MIATMLTYAILMGILSKIQTRTGLFNFTVVVFVIAFFNDGHFSEFLKKIPVYIT